MNKIFWRLFAVIYLIVIVIHASKAQDFDLVKEDSLELLFYDNDSTQIVLMNVNTGKYGCIDTSGNLIVSFEYDYLGRLNDGLRVAGLNSMVGYLDEQGDQQIAFEYLGADHFSNGKAIVINQEGFGVIDKYNQVLLPFHYGSLSTEDHKYYVFKKSGGKVGLMDSLGQVVIPEIYDNILLQNDSIWVAMLDRKFELFKYHGEKHLKEKFNRISKASYSGYITVVIDRKKGILDAHYNWILPPVYKAVSSLFDNYLGAEDSLGWKVYNANQEQVFDEVFDGITYLNRTHCIVRKGQRENVININGEIMLDPNTEKVMKIHGEKTLLYIDGYLYDGLALNKILQEKVTLISNRPSLEKGNLVVMIKGKCAVIDTIGNFIISPQYDYCEDYLSFGYLKVSDNEREKWGLVNLDNELIIPLKYKYIDRISGSYADAKFWLEEETTRSFFSNQKILVSDIDSIVDYLGDFIFFKKNNKLGFINSYKDTFRMLEYDSIITDRFPLVVMQDGKYGSLNRDGNLDIPCQYDYLRAEGSYFIIKEGDKYGTLSLEKKVMENPKFDKIEKGAYKMYGKAFINNKIGLLDTEGKLLLPVEYDALDVKGSGQVTAQKGDKIFYFNCVELEIKGMD